MPWIEPAFWILVGYLTIGVAVGGFIVWRGVNSIDPAAENAARWARLLWWPGAAALWPVVGAKWVRTIRQSPAPPARTSMRGLRFAHAIAWTLATPAVIAGVVWALAHRLPPPAMPAPATAQESSP